MSSFCERAKARGTHRLSIIIGAAIGALACGGSHIPEARTAIPELPTDQTRCQLAANQESPLVTEWPASEKANLEALLGEGAVVVSYSGCSLKLLPSCRVAGSYAWRRTTASTDVLEIHNADELYAKLPLGAVSLEGELKQKGQLAVQTTVSGQMQLREFDPSALLRDSSCQGATHVVSALSIGAFKLRGGGESLGQGGVKVVGMGTAAGSSERSEGVLREAGVPARCEDATAEAPHNACASPIQLFLRPLPNNIVDRGPVGTVKVRFWPVRPDEPWEVVVGDRKLCATPCEKWVDPAMPYSLKYDPGFWHKNEFVELPDLRQYAALERLEVRVVPRRAGEFAVGVVATSLGGAAAATGIVLTSAGCANKNGLCTAGLITLPVGLAVAAPGIWMILDSAGKIQVNPAGEAATASVIPGREPSH